jgi:transaldolase
MKNNPLIELEKLGQSVWFDSISRNLIASGELHMMIENDGISGITSNPAIFEKAITGSHDYDEDIRVMIKEGKDSAAVYEAISLKDVRMAADEFLPVYDRKDGKDGFVSLEVNPHLAHDTKGTIEEARRLWKALNRPNVMIKVPATLKGLPAITQLISEGINVNITLLFGLPRYNLVAEAYIAGMEMLAAKGKPLNRVASVASFFISRIDTLIDPMEEQFQASGAEQAHFASEIKGEVGIASAKLAYKMYKDIFGSERFARLADKGARAQKLLWASTGTKNPDYSNIKYVEALIGENTINTIPPDTLDAYLDHGKPEIRLESGMEKAEQVMKELAESQIDIDKITKQLEDEGVEKFNKPYDLIMATLDKAREKR